MFDPYDQPPNRHGSPAGERHHHNNLDEYRWPKEKRPIIPERSKSGAARVGQRPSHTVPCTAHALAVSAIVPSAEGTSRVRNTSRMRSRRSLSSEAR
jgi:hypothetical protein